MATKERTLLIAGMICASCANRIERGLGKLDGMQDVRVNLATERATIAYHSQQVQPAALVGTISTAATASSASASSCRSPVGQVQARGAAAPRLLGKKGNCFV